MNSDRVTLGVGIALVVFAIVAVIAVALAPSGLGGRLETVMADAEALRRAELDHLEAFGYPVPAASAPRDVRGLGDAPVPWIPSPGFEVLAWAPADRDAVYASFAVTVDEARRGDFVVTARCDLDGDGTVAVFEGNRGTPVARTSEPGVR